MATSTRSRRKALSPDLADTAPPAAIEPVAPAAAAPARKRSAARTAAPVAASPVATEAAAPPAAKRPAAGRKTASAETAAAAPKAPPAGKKAPAPAAVPAASDKPAAPARKAAASAKQAAAPAQQVVAPAKQAASPAKKAAAPAKKAAAPAKKAAAPVKEAAAPAKKAAAPVKKAATPVKKAATPVKKAAAAAKKAAAPAKKAVASAPAVAEPAEVPTPARKAVAGQQAQALPAPVAALPQAPAAPVRARTRRGRSPAAPGVAEAPAATPALAAAPTPAAPASPAPRVEAAADDTPVRRSRQRHRPARASDAAAETAAERPTATVAATPAEAPAPQTAPAPAAVDATPVAPPPAVEGAAAPAPRGRSRGRGRDRDRRRAAEASTDLAAPARPELPTEPPAQREAAAPPAPAPAPTPAPVPAPTGPAHSAVVLIDGDQRRIAWQPGHACPPALRQAAAQRLDADGHLPAGDDDALPALLRIANDSGHGLRIDEAVWAHLAAHRDARTRLARLEVAYPDGPASAALQSLLRVPLPLFQAEGALFAVIAGRALIADDRGLGKGVQAIAAAALWRRHFGVRRVLVLCHAAQRAAWQRAWQRFTGEDAPPTAQVMDGGLMQRQALWSTDAGVRILSPEALASDAAHIVHWAPDLVIVDEPQQLDLHDDAWATLQAPHALVLSGAPLADQPALTRTLVAWLDAQRLGPLAALHELQQAAEQGLALGEDDLQRLTDSLSRLMLQRGREDVAEQLPTLVHSELPVALAPGQREAHDAPLAQARRLLAGWQGSGYLSDGDQWRLAEALRAMQWAAHRADPAAADSALAEASVQAIETQLAAWASTGPLNVALLCPTPADRDQLAARLATPPGLVLVAPGEPLPDGPDVVLQFGVPWRPRRQPAGARGAAPAGQQQLYLVALGSIDAGLFDTLTLRGDAPRGPADGRGFLHGERLADWLGALQAALQVLPAASA